MEKVGYRGIPKNKNGGKPITCISCGALATRQVTFRDNWGILRVNLCIECAGKGYEALKLQSRIKWPGAA